MWQTAWVLFSLRYAITWHYSCHVMCQYKSGDQFRKNIHSQFVYWLVSKLSHLINSSHRELFPRQYLFFEKRLESLPGTRGVPRRENAERSWVIFFFSSFLYVRVYSHLTLNSILSYIPLEWLCGEMAFHVGFQEAISA